MQMYAAELERKNGRVLLDGVDVTGQMYAADDVNGWVDVRAEPKTTGARFSFGNEGEIWIARRFGKVQFELPDALSMTSVDAPIPDGAPIEYVAQVLIFHSRLRTYFQPGEIIPLDHLSKERLAEMLHEGYVKPRAVESDVVTVEAYRNADGEFVSPKVQDADGKPERITHRKRAKEEVTDGTDDANSN